MPQVARAGKARGTKPGARTPSRRREGAPPGQRRKVSNWASAQMRAARYRAGHALRLAAFAVLGVFAVVVGLLAAFGQLEGVGETIEAGAERRLAEAGFTVGSVDVAGASRTRAAEIAEAIGARPGRGILEIDPEEAREAIEALAWVESAAVARLWPDRISVVLVEREPFALWQVDGFHHVVDRSGAVIEGASALDHPALPQVVGAGAAEHAAEILALLDNQPGIAERVTHAVRVGQRRWNLRLASGGDLMLPENDPAAALATIAALHEENAVLDLDARTFDLRVDGELAVRAWPGRTAEAAPERGA